MTSPPDKKIEIAMTLPPDEEIEEALIVEQYTRIKGELLRVRAEKGVSLDDLVRSDIEEWLSHADKHVYGLKNYEYDAESESSARALASKSEFLAQFTSREFQIGVWSWLITAIRKCLANNDLATAYRLKGLAGQFNHLLFRSFTAPDAMRGAKIVRAARAGHEAHHGDSDKKRAKWRRICDDYRSERAKGTRKAATIVARRHKVSVETVYRAQRYIKKIDCQSGH